MATESIVDTETELDFLDGLVQCAELLIAFSCGVQGSMLLVEYRAQAAMQTLTAVNSFRKMFAKFAQVSVTLVLVQMILCATLYALQRDDPNSIRPGLYSRRLDPEGAEARFLLTTWGHRHAIRVVVQLVALAVAIDVLPLYQIVYGGTVSLCYGIFHYFFG